MEEPLEAITDRLRSAGFDPGPIMDEGFGRSMRVRDPDGVWVNQASTPPTRNCRRSSGRSTSRSESQGSGDGFVVSEVLGSDVAPRWRPVAPMQQ
jgi:hypothetical protein